MASIGSFLVFVVASSSSHELRARSVATTLKQGCINQTRGTNSPQPTFVTRAGSQANADDQRKRLDANWLHLRRCAIRATNRTKTLQRFMFVSPWLLGARDC